MGGTRVQRHRRNAPPWRDHGSLRSAPSRARLAGLVASRRRGHGTGRSAHDTLHAAADCERLPARTPTDVIAIDHIVAMSPDLARTVDALQRAGLDLRRVRDEPTPAGAPRQAFFRLGREILEVVQEPNEAVARAGDPNRPARFWGLALLAEDIELAAAAFGPGIGTIRAAVQPGRRIATVDRAAGLSVPVALMSRDERGSRTTEL